MKRWNQNHVGNGSDASVPDLALNCGIKLKWDNLHGWLQTNGQFGILVLKQKEMW